MAAVKTGVLPTKLFKTTTLVSVMLPEFRTVPLKVNNPPGTTGLTGQFWVTTMLGAVVKGQVVVAAWVTSAAVQASLPVAVTVLLTAHASAGAVKLTVKFAVTPGARLGTVNTVLGEA